MKYMFLIVAVWMLAGCTIESDTTQRAQIYADASVDRATQERMAEEERAYQRRLEAEARASADVNMERIRQEAKTERSQMWLIVAVIVAASGLAYVFIQRRSEERIAQLRYGLPSPSVQPPYIEILKPPLSIAAEAQRRGCDVEQIGGVWCLVHPSSRQIVARARQLPGG